MYGSCVRGDSQWRSRNLLTQLSQPWLSTTGALLRFEFSAQSVRLDGFIRIVCPGARSNGAAPFGPRPCKRRTKTATVSSSVMAGFSAGLCFMMPGCRRGLPSAKPRRTAWVINMVRNLISWMAVLWLAALMASFEEPAFRNSRYFQACS